MIEVVLNGGGSIYTARDFKPNAEYEVGSQGTVAPAFSKDEDVRAWRDLNERRFRKMTIILEDE